MGQLISLGLYFPMYKMGMVVVLLVRPFLRTRLTREPVQAFSKCCPKERGSCMWCLCWDLAPLMVPWKTEVERLDWTP